MKERKPRTKKNYINYLLEKHGPECEWWDGGYPECMLPWGIGISSKNKENGCMGNPFMCKKLYYRYLNSVKNPQPGVISEFESRMKRRSEDYVSPSEKYKI